MIGGYAPLALTVGPNSALLLRDRQAKANEVIDRYADVNHMLEPSSSFRTLYNNA